MVYLGTWSWRYTYMIQCTADPCWIFTLFRLIRMLSIELYTCMQPSSVPNHMVGSPSKSTGSVGYMPSGTRSWLASFSSSSSLEELQGTRNAVEMSVKIVRNIMFPIRNPARLTCLIWCRAPSGRCLRPICWFPDCWPDRLCWRYWFDWRVEGGGQTNKKQKKNSSKKKKNAVLEVRRKNCTHSTRCGAGIEVTHRIRALHTPLHEVTVGSGYRLNTHTWPTYPSLLHTHTSLWFNAGAAHVNCRPARVLRMGTGPTKSAFGLRSVDNTAWKRNEKKNASWHYLGLDFT